MQRLLLPFFLLLTLAATAQPYQSVLTPERAWMAYFRSCDICPNAPFALTGDTLYNGLAYRTTSIVTNDNGTDFPLLLRESADGTRLYAATGNGTDYAEELIMDLDLAVGDTFEYNVTVPDWLETPLVVSRIATVDGRKVLTFGRTDDHPCDDFYSFQDAAGQTANPPDSLRFIEGVGPSHFYERFLCNTTVGDSVQWSATAYGAGPLLDCSMINCTSPTRNLPGLAFTFSPNPATAHLDLALPGAGNYTLRLYDTVGREWQVHETTGTTTYRMPIDALPPGVYFLEVRDGQRRGTQRVVVR